MKVKMDWMLACAEDGKGETGKCGSRITTPGKAALREFTLRGLKISLDGLRDVILERSGQIDAWAKDHDKRHGALELIGAAINYAEAGAGRPHNAEEGAKAEGWQRDWMKGKDGKAKPPRQWCIEAAALLIAAVDVMDQQAAKPRKKT